MIDGRGHIWRPLASNAEALRRYTFGTQILETYDFTRAVQVAVREYAPDRIILLGPGDTLGGAIAQALIAIEWRGLRSKRDFQEMQASADPVLLAMGREDQRGARDRRLNERGRRLATAALVSRSVADQSLLNAPFTSPFACWNSPLVSWAAPSSRVAGSSLVCLALPIASLTLPLILSVSSPIEFLLEKQYVRSTISTRAGSVQPRSPARRMR